MRKTADCGIGMCHLRIPSTVTCEVVLKLGVLGVSFDQGILEHECDKNVLQFQRYSMNRSSSTENHPEGVEIGKLTSLLSLPLLVEMLQPAVVAHGMRLMTAHDKPDAGTLRNGSTRMRGKMCALESFKANGSGKIRGCFGLVGILCCCCLRRLI